MVKSLPANVGDLRDKGLSPELGRSPGGGHGNPLQYSSLGNPRDRGAWQATVHAVANSWTRLKQFSMQHTLCSKIWALNYKVTMYDKSESSQGS